MPINPAAGNLVNPVDSLTVQLNGDPAVIFSLSGTFQNAVVIAEAILPGQATYTPIATVRSDTGVQFSGPLGPISGSGLGSGLTLRGDGSILVTARLRLVSITSGVVAAGIATIPFPAVPGLTPTPDPVAATERGRMRVALSILMEGMGINMQDLTQADINAFTS